MTDSATSDDQPNFSLVSGGLLYLMYQKARLCGEDLELMRRRLAATACIAWLPLLILSAFAGHAMGDAVKAPFLHDIEAHIRFLIALPILIAGERLVHLRIVPVVKNFVERGLVGPGELPEFRAAIASTLQLRNSKLLEIVLLVVVYAAGVWVWQSQSALRGSSWYAAQDGAKMHLTPAGYWHVFVSLPLFQFIVLRWYLRLFLWFRFLWRVSRLNLRLMPLHPDKAGGLGFLARSTHAFGPVLFAQGALLAGLIAGQIFHAGQNLMAFKMQIAGCLGFFIAVVLSPLLVFMPHLARGKRQGLNDYGWLAGRYVRQFEEKWTQRGAAADSELLGAADIQSLADLGNSYAVVKEMRLVPFGLRDATTLAATAALPLLPLTLTIFSFEELTGRLIDVLF